MIESTINQSYDSDMKTLSVNQQRFTTTPSEFHRQAPVSALSKDSINLSVKGLEAIEDQLSDIQDTLDNLAEDNRYGSDAYWHKQVVDLTKFYLQDMIAQRHRSGIPLTEDDVIKLVSIATNVATKSIEAVKNKVSD